jgi:hypothetical protein
MGYKGLFSAIALGLFVSVGAVSAATIETCGNKSFSATQGTVDLSVNDPGSICGDQGGNLGNSTGGNSLISAAGWTSGAEVQGSDPSGSSGEGDGRLTLNIGDNANNPNVWEILNPFGYSMLGLSIKHGNGFAFYVLDAGEALSGDWFTYDNGTAGNAFSHINAWYKGAPSAVPLPAAGLLLLGAFGGLVSLRRRNRKAA